MEARLPLFSISFTVLLEREHLLSRVGLDPAAAWAAEGYEEKQRSCTKDSEKRETGSKMCSYPCDSRARQCVFSFTTVQIIADYAWLLLSLFTPFGGIHCRKSWTTMETSVWSRRKSSAPRLELNKLPSAFPNTLLPFSTAAIHLIPVLPPHPTSTPYKLPCNHHCLSRGGMWGSLRNEQCSVGKLQQSPRQKPGQEILLLGGSCF